MAMKKTIIAKRFSKSASLYEQAAVLQNRIADQLLNSLPSDLHGSLIDLGCGTGRLLNLLESSFKLDLHGLDISDGMLEVAAKRTSAKLMQGDIESTPFSSRTFETAVSNVALQWTDLSKSAHECQRILKPGGRFHFSTFGPKTLEQWRVALKKISPERTHLHRFPSQEKIVNYLTDSGFQDIQLTSALSVERFETVREMMGSIRELGASYAGSGSGYFGRERYRQLLKEFEATRNDQGLIELTYEIYFVSCHLAE